LFDIRLSKGCKTAPDLGDLPDLIPELADKRFYATLFDKNPGFLSLNIPEELARKLVRRLLTARAQAGIIPVRYRDREPIYTVEMAYPIAEKALKELQAKYPDITFGPIKFSPHHSGRVTLGFLSAGKEWVESGLIPGALIVAVDRLDGHIWSEEDYKQMAT